ATTLGTGTLSSGSASFTTSALAVGSHSITAEYGNDGNFNASTSGALTQTVNPADTTTSVSSSVNPSVYGQSVSFTANVSANAPASGTPGGTVQFTIDGVDYGSAVALSGGTASVSDSGLAVGNHSVSATYGGSASFNGSGGALLGGQTVDKAG